MFRVARVLRGVSPFSIFLMDQKSNPALKGVPIAKRGRMLSKMYKELSQQQRKELQKRAESHPSMNKKKTRKRPSRKSEFSEFVRENYNVVKGLNYRKRFSALSQLYELRKPLDVQVAKAIKEVNTKKRVAPAKKAVKKAVKKAASKAASKAKTAEKG
ncbi:putative mitochondrial kinetoplast DNA-associated protein [Leptomonas pyrrhocoris]|uniref:Putative mitochondrial kinetoplast DNA-associated protein n=1 Tax=Leptomonas pyrrhocoris TaxID=157538 RepID=A0A0M9G3Q0_LEPPY|nr:putative mitochondrial kinetoplast DNA-associated protein [Leptomonas pyrrhocoris]KPA81735.1 putative mitochondrial kinetoplast DNA-associated protein [Leptomonas pyrrhocoris]|eukprot:XP_015660174.1 putative mitochondrial kinetoplast DNA-associated protein [Leptomonas pyrrhocoris]